MPTEIESLELTQIVKAAPAAVYRALTNEVGWQEWLCNDAQAEARPGGRLYLWWQNGGYYAAGQYSNLEADKMVGFSWHGRGEPRPTEVVITLAEEGEGTRLTLVHSGLEAGSGWAAEVREGWEQGLENLASVLETGMDLRITRRPMLGIFYGGDVSGQTAAELGVPVHEGVRLGGTVAGLSAEAAGLQKDDVVVKVEGTETPNWPALGPVLRGRRVGDQLEVVYYRGPEQHTAMMELRPRQMPVVPDEPGELADIIAGIYGELDGELDEMFEGVSEAEAACCPAEGEWSANEVLAHLITVERDWQSIIASMIEGGRENIFHSNIACRVKATAQVLGGRAALLAELKRTERETVALLRGLPAEFVGRRGSYIRLGHGVLEFAYHSRTHFDQIRSALSQVSSKQ